MTRRLAVCLLMLAISATCHSESMGIAAAKHETEEASRLLDARTDFESARVILEYVILRHPECVQAYVELARYEIMVGQRDYLNFAPGSLQRAEEYLDQAVAVSPEYVNAYVLYGHLYLLMHRPRLARAALEHADRIGTDSPWLNVNWGAVLEDEHKWDEAIARYQSVLASHTENARARDEATTGLIDGYIAKKEFAKVRELSEQRIRLHPDNAIYREIYAFDLLHEMGDVEGSIALFQESLKISDSLDTRFGLATAYYAQWARLKDGAHRNEAEADFDQAGTLYPHQGAVLVRSCEYLATHFLCSALARRGLGLEARDEMGDTALTLVAFGGKLDEAAALIDMGADIEAKDANGMTPLMLAALEGHLDMVKLLVSRGANIRYANDEWDAIAAARSRDYDDVIDFLESKIQGE